MFFLGSVRDDCLQQMAIGFHSGSQGPWQKGIGVKVTIVQSNRTLGKVFACMWLSQVRSPASHRIFPGVIPEHLPGVPSAQSNDHRCLFFPES